MPIPKKLIDGLLESSESKEISTQILVPGGIFSGALRASAHEGTYEFLMAVPTAGGGAQYLKMHVSQEAIIGIAEIPESKQTTLFTPGGQH